MVREEDRDTGIPTRAIHEAYLAMQQAHRQFRRARDNDLDTHGPQGELQDAVLSFYELVRPHLKHETALSDYWSGDVPDYTSWDFTDARDAAEYVRDRGTGVYQIQQHVDTVEVNQQVLTDGGVQTFDEWHDLLGLSWNSERLVAVQDTGEGPTHVVKLLRIAVLPLRQLDDWRAEITRERTAGSGFMAGETSVETRREFQSPIKLITAKRLLVEAADRLGALSEFEASTQRTKITREDIDKVEEWRQAQLE